MNYTKHYNTLIERARNRDLPKPYERHHVIPKCLGGSNDKSNLVKLTPEEHYVAHQLLVKMYPNNNKLIFAATAMWRNAKTLVRNNKDFGWLKKRASVAMSEVQKGHIPWNKGTKGLTAAWNKGLVTPDNVREKIRASLGKVEQSNETRLKRSESLKAYYEGNKKIVSEETSKKISDSLKGNIPWNKGKKGLQEAWNKGLTKTKEKND